MSKPIVRRLPGKQNLVADVVARWRRQYPSGGECRLASGHDASEIGNALANLPADATAEDVNRIIGNKSWTEDLCDVCMQYSATVFQIGDEPDYESATVTLCAACARRLLTELAECLAADLSPTVDGAGRQETGK